MQCWKYIECFTSKRLKSTISDIKQTPLWEWSSWNWWEYETEEDAAFDKRKNI